MSRPRMRQLGGALTLSSNKASWGHLQVRVHRSIRRFEIFVGHVHSRIQKWHKAPPFSGEPMISSLNRCLIFGMSQKDDAFPTLSQSKESVRNGGNGTTLLNLLVNISTLLQLSILTQSPTKRV
jgi:hypothetical protein